MGDQMRELEDEIERRERAINEKLKNAKVIFELRTKRTNCPNELALLHQNYQNSVENANLEFGEIDELRDRLRKLKGE